jgi:hypothetical protein
MRPIYETEQDRTREEQTFKLLAENMGFDYINMPQLSVVDKLLCYKDKRLAAIAELKIRTNRFNAYPTYLFSETKCSALLSISEAIKVPALLIVRFSDQIAFTKLRSGYDQKLGGRVDRGDSKDMETCVFIPMREFKTIMEL